MPTNEKLAADPPSLSVIAGSGAAAEGAGVSACEVAGYVYGSLESGVRGKAGTPGFWAPEMLHYEKDGKGRRYGAAAAPRAKTHARRH